MLVQKHNVVEEFLDSIFVLSHSHNTLKSYRTGISKFQIFLKERYESDEFQVIQLIKDKQMDVYKILSEFVLYLDKGNFTPKTLRTWIPAVKGYLRHMGIKIYSEDFRQNVRMPKMVSQREEPLTKEILVRLLHNASPNLQTAILFATASGLRIGELVQLKISDIDFESVPTKVRIRAEITKTKESRETFLTKEAAISLKDYLQRSYGWKDGENNLDLQEQLIFYKRQRIRNQENSPSLRLYTSVSVAKNLLQKPLRERVKKISNLNIINGNGRKAIHFHAFRKFFRTVVGDAVGRDFAEALIGHHFYMDTYYNLPEDKKRKMYLQAETYLTISDFTKVEKSISELSEKYIALQQEFAMFRQNSRKNSIDVPESFFEKTDCTKGQASF